MSQTATGIAMRIREAESVGGLAEWLDAGRGCGNGLPAIARVAMIWGVTVRS